MPNDNFSKYFIALVPPEPIFSEAMDWKQHFADHYNSKGALRSPAHITLHMPFLLKDNRLAVLHQSLASLSLQAEASEIRLDGFGAFAPRVIYINVIASDWLYHLYKSVAATMRTLQQFNSDYGGHGFTPHLTIAFRDLKPAAFHKAWPELENRPFRHQFTPTHLHLLRHDDQRWNLLQAYPLASPKKSKTLSE